MYMCVCVPVHECTHAIVHTYAYHTPYKSQLGAGFFSKSLSTAQYDMRSLMFPSIASCTCTFNTAYRTAPNFQGAQFSRIVRFKHFAKTIFADQGNPVSHALQKKKFVVLNFHSSSQSAKTVKIMCLGNLVLYGSTQLTGWPHRVARSVESHTHMYNKSLTDSSQHVFLSVGFPFSAPLQMFQVCWSMSWRLPHGEDKMRMVGSLPLCETHPLLSSSTNSPLPSLPSLSPSSFFPPSIPLSLFYLPLIHPSFF